MAKKTEDKKDVKDEANVDAADTAPAPVATSEPAPKSDDKRVLTFTSAKPPSLADLNKVAYEAHKADAEVMRKAAEVAQREIMKIIGRTR